MHAYISAEITRQRMAELHASAAARRQAREAMRSSGDGRAPRPGWIRWTGLTWTWLRRTWLNRTWLSRTWLLWLRWLSWPWAARRRPGLRPARAELVWPDGIRSVVELPPLTPDGRRPGPAAGAAGSAGPDGSRPARGQAGQARR